MKLKTKFTYGLAMKIIDVFSFFKIILNNDAI